MDKWKGHNITHKLPVVTAGGTVSILSSVAYNRVRLRQYVTINRSVKRVASLAHFTVRLCFAARRRSGHSNHPHHPTQQMSDTSYNLWCFLQGDHEAFSVTVPSDMLISNLKKRIKVEKENTLRTVDASDLILWKVRYFLVIYSDIIGPLYP